MLLFFLNVRWRDFTLPVVGALLFGLSSVLIGGVVPAFVQRFQVTPQELQREEPYIQRNIDATRKAFNLEGVRTNEFPASDDLTPAEVRANTATVDNIRLWEADVLKTAIQNLQAIGQYYEFSDVDVDRYRIDRALRQVMISAREVDSRNLDASAQTWVNLYLAYTHGYGVVAAQVNRAGTSGGPTLSSAASISSRRPSRSASHVSTSGSPHRTRPPTWWSAPDRRRSGSPSVSGQGQASFRYDGLGGVQLSSPLRRLAAALHFTDLNLLISSNLDGRSRILFNRDIRDRVEKAAPFLQWDADPYVAVVDGRSSSSVTATRSPTTTRTRSGSRSTSPHGGPTPRTRCAWRSQLHPELGQGGRRRLRRHHHPVRLRRDRPAAADLAQGVPKPVRAPLGADPRAAGAPALSGGPVLHPDRPVRLLPSALRATSTPSRTSGPSPRTARANSPTARARSWWPAPSPGCGPTTCSPSYRGSGMNSSCW